jgi:hypothetical protein
MFGAFTAITDGIAPEIGERPKYDFPKKMQQTDCKNTHPPIP